MKGQTGIGRHGNRGRIFIANAVKDEIARAKDDFSKWLKQSSIPTRQIIRPATVALQDIYKTDPKHKFLELLCHIQHFNPDYS